MMEGERAARRILELEMMLRRVVDALEHEIAVGGPVPITPEEILPVLYTAKDSSPEGVNTKQDSDHATTVELKLSEVMAALDPRIVLMLATPGDLLARENDDCAFCRVYRSIVEVKGHTADTIALMQALWEWHNRRTTGLPDEAFFRCVAIYGAAAELLINVEERIAEGGAL